MANINTKNVSKAEEELRLAHEDLIDGEDFISFNLENLHEKLDYIYDNRDEIDKIRFNGKLKLHKGFDVEKSAKILYEKIKEN